MMRQFRLGGCSEAFALLAVAVAATWSCAGDYPEASSDGQERAGDQTPGRNDGSHLQSGDDRVMQGPRSQQEPSHNCPASSPATRVFDHAICVCEDLRDIGNLIVGQGVDGVTAVVGVNGAVKLINNTMIGGSLVVGRQLRVFGNLIVDKDAFVGSDVQVWGHLRTAQDLAVGGNLDGIGYLNVGGTLRVAGQTRLIGFPNPGGVGAYRPAGQPCGCNPNQLLDVAQAVREARQTNDNAQHGLPTNLANVGFTLLTLQSGTYYFDNVNTIGATRIYVDGTVALYLDGSIDSIGHAQVKLAPGATLDLYVSGSVDSVGNIMLGDPRSPSAFRLYVGGEDPVSLSVGNKLFNGALYAPKTALKYVGNTAIRGSIFVKRLLGVGNLTVGHAPPAGPPERCPGPADQRGPNDDPFDDPPEEKDPPAICVPIAGTCTRAEECCTDACSGSPESPGVCKDVLH